jgi:parvulin-like peptidyl-prolyl isomerase
MIKRLLTDPLTIFIGLGALLFAVFELTAAAPQEREDDLVVAITAQEVDQIEAAYRGMWRRDPSPEERERLIAAYVREEIMVREAEALGLDRGDRIIRQRLQQKMEFLLSAAANATPPTDADLTAYLEDNAERYIRPAEVAFTQVYLGRSPSGETVAEALARLRAGADPASLGERLLVADRMGLTPVQAVDAQFGAGFAAQLAALDAGLWDGPVPSGYGQHLVLVAEQVPARLPPLAEIRDRVEADWRRDRTASLAEEQYQRLAARYRIDLPEDDG